MCSVRLLGEIWTHLPIWFVFVGSLSLHHIVVGVIDPSRYAALGHSTPAFALTALAPVACVIIYYAARIGALSATGSGAPALRALPALFLLPFLVEWAVYSRVPSLRAGASENTLRLVFEYSQFAWCLALAAHAYLTRGSRALIAFFVIGLVYGVMLENTGITLGFFSELRYDWYLPRLPAPLATMLGWSMIAYCGVWIAGAFGRFFPWLGSTPMRLAAVASVVALCVDVQLDPVASLDGVYWKWNSLLPRWFLSVPFCNFAAWIGAYPLFAWAYFSLQRVKDLTEDQRNWRLLARVPVLAVAGGLIWLALMTVYEVGTSGPTYQILGEYFGL